VTMMQSDSPATLRRKRNKSGGMGGAGHSSSPQLFTPSPYSKLLAPHPAGGVDPRSAQTATTAALTPDTPAVFLASPASPPHPHDGNDDRDEVSAVSPVPSPAPTTAPTPRQPSRAAAPPRPTPINDGMRLTSAEFFGADDEEEDEAGVGDGSPRRERLFQGWGDDEDLEVGDEPLLQQRASTEGRSSSVPPSLRDQWLSSSSAPPVPASSSLTDSESARYGGGGTARQRQLAKKAERQQRFQGSSSSAHALPPRQQRDPQRGLRPYPLSHSKESDPSSVTETSTSSSAESSPERYHDVHSHHHAQHYYQRRSHSSGPPRNQTPPPPPAELSPSLRHGTPSKFKTGKSSSRTRPHRSLGHRHSSSSLGGSAHQHQAAGGPPPQHAFRQSWGNERFAPMAPPAPIERLRDCSGGSASNIPGNNQRALSPHGSMSPSPSEPDLVIVGSSSSLGAAPSPRTHSRSPSRLGRFALSMRKSRVTFRVLWLAALGLVAILFGSLMVVNLKLQIMADDRTKGTRDVQVFRPPEPKPGVGGGKGKKTTKKPMMIKGNNMFQHESSHHEPKEKKGKKKDQAHKADSTAKKDEKGKAKKTSHEDKSIEGGESVKNAKKEEKKEPQSQHQQKVADGTLYKDKAAGRHQHGTIKIGRGAGGLRISTAGGAANEKHPPAAANKKQKKKAGVAAGDHHIETVPHKAKRVFPKFDSDMYAGSHRHGKKGGHSRIHNIDHHVTNDKPPPDRKPRTVELYPAEFSDNTQLYPLFDSADEDEEAKAALSKMEIRAPLEQGDCVPMQEWQTTYHPSCNGMHEIDIINSHDEDEGTDLNLFGLKGFWRNAWKLERPHNDGKLGEMDRVVLKTLRYMHNFEDNFFEFNRIDAISMERLTSSPHVIDIYGFCGHSVLTEFADGPRLGTLADKTKKVPLKRLEIARDIASGLADVHGIDGDGNSTFVHLDVNPANVVVINGTLKLNDFNIGILRKWNKKKKKPCGFPAQFPNPQWRSPEEANERNDLTEKVDVFSMGHIFFRLICGHEPWNKLEPGGRPTKEEVDEKVKAGKLPFVPKDIMESKDPEIVAVRDAMFKCYTIDPAKRPDARSIARSLDNELSSLKRKTVGVEEKKTK